MITLTGGGVAITFEDRGGTLRLLDHLPAAGDAHPPFVAAAEITRLNDTIAKISALRGAGVTRRHLRLIARLLTQQGYATLYADRLTGHILPQAEPITAGDWMGWWRVDLGRAVGRKPAEIGDKHTPQTA